MRNGLQVGATRASRTEQAGNNDMRCFNQLSQSAVYKQDEISVSVTVCGGSYGGGSEVLVCGEVLTEKQRGRLMDTITLAVETGGERKGDCVQRADHDERPQRSQRNIRERNRNDIDITRKGATIDNGERSKTIDTDGMRTVAGLS